MMDRPLTERQKALIPLFERLKALKGQALKKLSEKSGLKLSTIYRLRSSFDQLARARGRTLDALEEALREDNDPAL